MVQEADQGSAGIRLAYMLDDRKWIRFRKGAAAVISSGTLGRAERMRAVVLGGIFWALIMLCCCYLVTGYLNWMLAGYSLGIALLLTLRLFFRDPERALKKQVRTPVIRDRECGVWRVTLSESEVSVELPANVRNDYLWEALGWLVETEEAFYLFHRDKKHYVLIAKESFQDWNHVTALHELCARKGLKFVQGRKMRYMPDWLVALLAVLVVVLCIALLVISIFWSHLRERMQGAQYEDHQQKNLDLPGQPDYVQVQVLESLGIRVPEETVESVRRFMTEYDMIEEDPYTYLLWDLGAPQYDGGGTVTYSPDVFWFDFEGSDYSDILNGMLALAEGSCLDSVSNIVVDTEDVDWEQGSGTVVLSLDWEGQTYAWDMDMYYDWVDGEVLGVLNALLMQEQSDQLFYMTGDHGQGAFVFFCTAEWAQDFQAATGLELEHYTAWTDEQKERGKTPYDED